MCPQQEFIDLFVLLTFIVCIAFVTVLCIRIGLKWIPPGYFFGYCLLPILSTVLVVSVLWPLYWVIEWKYIDIFGIESRAIVVGVHQRNGPREVFPFRMDYQYTVIKEDGASCQIRVSQVPMPDEQRTNVLEGTVIPIRYVPWSPYISMSAFQDEVIFIGTRTYAFIAALIVIAVLIRILIDRYKERRVQT